MKRQWIWIPCLCTALGLQAQSHYDANRLMQQDLNGTARFVGMGGAMSALGGDVSTMGVNPAGTGIYRSSDAMISFGFNRSNSESAFSGMRMKDGATQASFDNAGFVYALKYGEKTTLRYVNFGFNYHKARSFNKQMAMGGEYVSNVSQTDQMAAQADGLPSSEFARTDVWDVNGIGWLSILGWDGMLIFDAEDDNKAYSGFPSLTKPYGDYRSKEEGALHSYDLNVSFNLKDRVYLGFTLGLYDVDYSRQTWYREGFDYLESTGDRSYYTLRNSFSTAGNGVDFKVGLIARPFEELPLRIGAAIHTPTLFNLKDYAEASLQSCVDIQLDGHPKNYMSSTPSGVVLTEYKIVTPWKYNVSLGYTIGRQVAIGAEYEFVDYATAKVKDFDGYALGVADGVDVKSSLKGVHAVRVGLEYKPISALALRAGYNHSTASVRDGSYKVLPYEGPNSVRTDTEYANTKATNLYTAGIGYRGRMFYADLAYQYKAYEEDFYPFDHVDLEAAKVKNIRHQALLTLGVRF